MFRSNKTKKIFICAMVAVVLLTQFTVLLYPTAVQAQVTVVGDIPAEKESIKKTIGATLLSTVMGGLMNAFSYFMRKLAYDSAMYLATGGKGQGSLAFKDGAGAYFKNVALDSVATGISELGKPFGMNLCNTPDLNFQVYLQIGLRNMYVGMEGGQGPTPDCSWQQMKGSWSKEAFSSKYGGMFDGGVEGTMERMFNNSVRVENSDFGIAYGAMASLDRNKAAAKGGAQASRLEGSGFKAAESLISGKIKTPAKVVEEETMSVTNKGQSTMTASQVAGVYGSGMLQVIPQALSVFLNTFISQGLKTVMGLLTGSDDGGGGDEYNDGVVKFDSAAVVSNRQKANAVFSQLLTVKLSPASNYSMVEEMSLCPALDDPNIMLGMDNCLIDPDFKMALDRSRMGVPLTIEQVLKENLLHGDWPLISPRRIGDNTSPNCAQGKYCYSNIQKLRRNRILPLGFEIAAYLADPDEPDKEWTLKQVVDGFSDCFFDESGNVIPDFDGHPYCHLIDPNWVLKAPTAQCNVLAYGPTLMDTQTGARAQYCADLRTCLTEAPGKACDAQQYGYCTREKNIWRFAGDSCDKVYNTCTGYFSSGGELNYYLARSLDYGECAIDNVGCLAYSAYMVDIDKWQETAKVKGLDYKKYGVNQAYYFNEKIRNESCGSDSEGCSKFYEAELISGNNESDFQFENKYNEESAVYLKKAPAYLGCYDINTTTPETNWPLTTLELAQLKPNEKCSEFAQVCLPEEVYCDSYIPETDRLAPTVPGRIGQENKCKEECVGYESFKKDATNFETAEFPLYFIPQNGQSCTADVEGCDEFTNIDELAKGGEGLEYFYDMKYCEKPTADNQAVFYSWEGSKTEGYVLKTHKLRPLTEKESSDISALKGLDIGVALEFPANSPAYDSDDVDFLNSNFGFCNKEGYNKMIKTGVAGINGSSNEDCRALYNKKGQIYYRLLDDTIQVAETCHPLRKSMSFYFTDLNYGTSEACDAKKGKWTGTQCERCYKGGLYDKEKDACVYWSTGEYGQCPANMNGCRRYIGNQGNNIEEVAYMPFEPSEDVLLGWAPYNNGSGIEIAAESLQVGLHSLEITGSAEYTFATDTLYSGDWYILRFWARGTGAKTTISFVQGNNIKYFTYDSAKAKSTAVSIGYDWRQYEFGPVQFVADGGDNPVKLQFDSSAKSLYFIDNLQLTRLNKTYYILRDSWKTSEGYNVPMSCDSTPDDPYPGKALGCKAYIEESTGDKVFAIGFEKLCREQAVGCRAIFDTHNTEEKELTLYNAWCVGNNQGKCVKEFTADDGYKTKFECEVPQNSKGCFIDKIVVPENTTTSVWSAMVVGSTIVIPADTNKTKPIFLTAHKNYQCAEKSLGCQLFGAEYLSLPGTASSTDVYLLNDPEKYIGSDRTLCRQDLVGCSEFKAGNEITYFKDPNLVGNTFCEYKKASQGGDVSYTGWFQKDVGICYNGDDKLDPQKLCRSTDDCGNKDYSCKDIGTVPCYGDYMLPGGEFGLWSNGNVNYKGMVGLCSEQENNCRELVDPMDRDKNDPTDIGHEYYVIFDDKLKAGLSECEGQVSWKKGCALFNKTDEPNLIYDAEATYNFSAKASPPHKLVSPSSTDKNDSNLLLKVSRDRECAEWLACRGSLPIPDTQSQSGDKYACYALQPCKEGSNFYCTQEASPEEYGSGEILDYDKYVTRDVSWFSGKEYDGYSLYEKYPVVDLDFVDLDKEDTKDGKGKMVLGYLNKNDDSACKNQNNTVKENGTKCAGGVCYDGRCVNASNGKFPDSLVNSVADDVKLKFPELSLVDNSCRAYPSQDSPFTDFTNTIVQKWSNGKPVDKDNKYVNASICQPKENCDCNYTKVGYGMGGGSSEYRYYSYSSSHSDIKAGGICQGGEKEGLSCSKNSDCGDDVSGATCIRKQSLTKQLGWNGFCLEPDISRRVSNRKDNNQDAFACLTWYPLDYAPNLFDVYYNDRGRGYVPPAGAGNPGQLYCLEMLGTGSIDIDEQPKLSCNPVNDPFNNYNFCKDFKYYCENADECSNTVSPMDDENPTSQDMTFWKNLLYTVHDFTWKLLDRLNPVHGLGTKDNHNYNYISRIDVGAAFEAGLEGNFFDDVPGGSWDDRTYGADNSLDKLRNEWSYVAAGFMATAKGNSLQEYAAPLFPDVEHKRHLWIYGYGGTKEQDEIYAAADIETQFESNEDSGILRHAPNRAERFLEKSMIYSISVVPIVVSEGGFDDASQVDIMAMGYPMTVFMDKEYHAEGASVNASELEMKISTAGGNCPFCKYWVMRTQNSPGWANNNNEEGYLVQWHKTDPVNGSTDIAPPYIQYQTADSYLVNPLRSSSAEGWAKPVVDCNDTDGKHFIALEFRFDKENGKFLGYRSRNCNMIKDGHEFGYGVAIVFTLRPMCVEAVKVYNDLEDTTNKAYTDNIWQTRGYVDLYKKPSADNEAHSSIELTYDISSAPFGSVNFSNIGQLTDKYANPWFRIFPDPQDGDIHAGMPRSCVTQFYSENMSNENNPKYSGECRQSGNFKDMSLGYNTDALKQPEEDFFIQDDEKLKFFDHLFAKAFSVVSRVSDNQLKNMWADESPENSGLLKDKKNFTNGDKSKTNGRPPFIYAAVDCTGENCSLDKFQASSTYNFSVNGIVDKEANEDLFGVRSKPVTARFFTWADHNQMPLRRIMMDWQEQEKDNEKGTIAGDMMGYYSNYKPYCESGDNAKECVQNVKGKAVTSTYFGMTCQYDAECPSGYTCAEVGPHFGNQSGITCEPRPAQRFFNYTCDADKYVGQDAATWPDYVYKVSEIDKIFTTTGWKDFLKKKSYNDNSLVCVYQPRIQVLDNWGWCSGGCAGDKGVDGRGGCYEGEGNLSNCTSASSLDQHFEDYSNIIVVAP